MILVTLISSLVSWYSAYLLSRAGRRIYLVPVVAILGIILGVLSGVGVVFLLIYASPEIFTANDILGGGVRYSAFSLFLGPYAAYRGYKKGKAETPVAEDDQKSENRTLSSGRNRFRQYSGYAVPKRIVLAIWVILSIFMIFSTYEGRYQLRFWERFVEHKITGERIWSTSIPTEIKGQTLGMPRSGLIPGTPRFAKARKLFPSFHDKPDAEFREHLEELADTKSRSSGATERNIKRTIVTFIGVLLLLIPTQLAYLVIVWGGKKFPPTRYGKQCLAIFASWIIASFTWALIDMGEDSFADFDFYYERFIIYPPIAFTLMALLWGWANRKPTVLKKEAPKDAELRKRLD